MSRYQTARRNQWIKVTNKLFGNMAKFRYDGNKSKQEAGEGWIMRSFIICDLHQILDLLGLSDQGG
jgi:hypothetical protein